MEAIRIHLFVHPYTCINYCRTSSHITSLLLHMYISICKKWIEDDHSPLTKTWFIAQRILIRNTWCYVIHNIFICCHMYWPLVIAVCIQTYNYAVWRAYIWARLAVLAAILVIYGGWLNTHYVHITHYVRMQKDPLLWLPNQSKSTAFRLLHIGTHIYIKSMYICIITYMLLFYMHIIIIYCMYTH
jgi:hypothetical protein